MILAEIGALPFQIHVLADDLHDVGGVADLFDYFVGNHFDSATRSTIPMGIISAPPR